MKAKIGTPQSDKGKNKGLIYLGLVKKKVLHVLNLEGFIVENHNVFQWLDFKPQSQFNIKLQFSLVVYLLCIHL